MPTIGTSMQRDENSNTAPFWRLCRGRLKLPLTVTGWCRGVPGKRRGKHRKWLIDMLPSRVLGRLAVGASAHAPERVSLKKVREQVFLRTNLQASDCTSRERHCSGPRRCTAAKPGRQSETFALVKRSATPIGQYKHCSNPVASHTEPA